MRRTILSFIGSFFLIFIECYLVLLITGDSTIKFGGISQFINIWAMNFFLLFTIGTDIKMYLRERAEENNTYSN